MWPAANPEQHGAARHAEHDCQMTSGVDGFLQAHVCGITLLLLLLLLRHPTDMTAVQHELATCRAGGRSPVADKLVPAAVCDQEMGLGQPP